MLGEKRKLILAIGNQLNSQDSQIYPSQVMVRQDEVLEWVMAGMEKEIQPGMPNLMAKDQMVNTPN
jgi:hypothetical protein